MHLLSFSRDFQKHQQVTMPLISMSEVSGGTNFRLQHKKKENRLFDLYYNIFIIYCVHFFHYSQAFRFRLQFSAAFFCCCECLVAAKVEVNLI